MYLARLGFDSKTLGMWRMGSDTGVDSFNDMGVDTFKNVYISAAVPDGGYAPFGDVNATAGTFVARALTVRACVALIGKGTCVGLSKRAARVA